MTDAVGTALHALDRAAEGLSIRELDRLHTLAVDIAATARRWSPDFPERDATLICECVFDGLLSPPAWCFLMAAVRVEFVSPQAATRSMLRASTDWLRMAALTAEDAGGMPK